MIFQEFFTLPLLKEDAKGQKFIFWQVDQKLQQYINSIVSQKPNISKPELVKIIFQNFQKYPEDKLNRRVWIAFLARFSYRAAFQIRTNIIKISTRVSLDYDSLFQDVFQMALTSALPPEKCLGNLVKDTEFEELALNIWYFKLEKYLRKRIEGLLCDKLREIEGFRTFQRSDLGLASRVTKTRAIAVLKRLGLNEVTISHHTLAWQCFQEAKDAGIINISSPQPQAFEAIFQRYHQFAQKLPKLSPNNQAVDGTVIQQWLQEIGRAIRNYIDFSQVSLDEPISQDSETLTWVDLIPDEDSIIPKDTISRNEIEDLVKELREFIYHKIDSLKAEEQRIPLFMHGLDLSQEKIGIELAANQSTVGRRYKKMLLELLSQLGTWVNASLKVDLNSEKLNELKIYLQEYLDVFYHNLMYTFLDQAIQLLELQTREMMRLFWLQQMQIEQIAELVNFTLLEVEDKLLLSHQSLKLDMIQRIENRLNLFLNPQGIVCNQVNYLMEEWLKIAPFADKK
ncbi:hypothetical protein NIES2100_29020 [Calothrix sp. NIES-2100]|uniref:hypothetical protein n=1 Tax=Calothrix sp. NIES-2100 TaxID=1954172 RepID=UPI000B60B30C|nr:hypothetical protein NIES2100_29020 [Calothrix sp. NIES-2100]